MFLRVLREDSPFAPPWVYHIPFQVYNLPFSVSVFSIGIPCSGHITAQVDIRIQINVTMRSNGDITVLNINRRKACLKGQQGQDALHDGDGVQGERDVGGVVITGELWDSCLVRESLNSSAAKGLNEMPSGWCAYLNGMTGKIPSAAIDSRKS